MPRNARWARSKPSLTRTHLTWLSEGPGGLQSLRLWMGPLESSRLSPPAWAVGRHLPSVKLFLGLAWHCPPVFVILPLGLPSLCWLVFPNLPRCVCPRHSSAIQGDGSSLLYFQLFLPSPSPQPSGVLSVHLSVTCCPLSQLVIFSMHHGHSGFDSCFPQTTSAPSFPTAAGSWKQ